MKESDGDRDEGLRKMIAMIKMKTMGQQFGANRLGTVSYSRKPRKWRLQDCNHT